MAGIYIHVPFCRQACHYCDFHFSTNLKLRNDMITAMVKEIVLRRDYLSENIRTIYFGGGTPSILPDTDITRLMEAIHDNLIIDEDAEVTLEINPDDVSNEQLLFWKSIGINRFSIGIQSFNDEFLKYLNRIHTAKEAIAAIDKIRNHGFDNFSLDLIYGIPSERHDHWKKDVKTAIDINPKHLSAYSLTIEPGTVFGSWLKKGKINEMNDHFISDQYHYLSEQSGAAGYEHYEISNFAKPGFYSKHNTSYWKGISYIGIGPGAHSFNGISRQANISNNPLYIKKINAGEVPFEKEELTSSDKLNEYLLTHLRTNRGINLIELRNKFNYTVSPEGSSLLEKMIERNLASMDNDTFILNEKGFLLADQIALELSL